MQDYLNRNIEQIVDVGWLKKQIQNGNKESLSEYLNPLETHIFNEFQNPKRTWEWLAGRVVAKRAVSLFVKSKVGQRMRLSDIIINNDQSGKPYCNLKGVIISISHKDEVAIAAVADNSEVAGIGIDIEEIQPRMRSMWEQFFTENEQELAMRLASEQGKEQSTYFSHFWAVKESVLKALGVGLSVDTRQVEIVSLSPEGNIHLSFHRLDIFSDLINAGQLSSRVEEKAGYVIARTTLFRYQSIKQFNCTQ
jgi:phosphopantetheine--protein transferase-like protein